MSKQNTYIATLYVTEKGVTQMKQLQVVHNAAARVVTRSRRSDHTLVARALHMKCDCMMGIVQIHTVQIYTVQPV